MALPAWLRFLLAVAAGNLLGYAAFRFARLALPALWQGRSESANLLQLIGLTAITFVLLAAPPVLAGAVAAWLARRAQLWAGLASGLWGLGLLARVPEGMPIAPGLWYAPAVLILLSGALGGWMLDLRSQAG